MPKPHLGALGKAGCRGPNRITPSAVLARNSERSLASRKVPAGSLPGPPGVTLRPCVGAELDDLYAVRNPAHRLLRSAGRRHRHLGALERQDEHHPRPDRECGAEKAHDPALRNGPLANEKCCSNK